MSWLRSIWDRHALTLIVCIAVCVPIFVVRFPPMQDFPVHTATLRILRDFRDPAAGFDQSYELVLGRTQYVGYYVMAWLVAFVTGPILASRLLVCFYLAGTLLGLRSLLVDCAQALREEIAVQRERAEARARPQDPLPAEPASNEESPAQAVAHPEQRALRDPDAL